MISFVSLLPVLGQSKTVFTVQLFRNTKLCFVGEAIAAADVILLANRRWTSVMNKGMTDSF